jgi:hypothetical protein
MNPSSASLPSPGQSPGGAEILSCEPVARLHDFLVLNQCPDLTPELPSRLPLPAASALTYRLHPSLR